MDILCGAARWRLRLPNPDGLADLSLVGTMPTTSSRTLRAWLNEGGRRRKPAETIQAANPSRGACPAFLTRFRAGDGTPQEERGQPERP